MSEPWLQKVFRKELKTARGVTNDIDSFVEGFIRGLASGGAHAIHKQTNGTYPQDASYPDMIDDCREFLAPVLAEEE